MLWIVSHPNNPSPTTTVPNELNRFKSFLIWPLALLLRALVESLRIQVPAQILQTLREEEGSVVFALWHNRSLISYRLHRIGRGKKKQLWGMVSASKDGAWLAAFYRKIGIHTVRGSTSRRGMIAAKALAKKAREGQDLGITVDGPRGPVYRAQAGAAWLMLASGAKLFLVVPVFENCWRVKSWDKYSIPKPFSRVLIKGEFWQPDPSDPRSQDREWVRQQIEDRLRALTAGTDPELGL